MPQRLLRLGISYADAVVHGVFPVLPILLLAVLSLEDPATFANMTKLFGTPRLATIALVGCPSVLIVASFIYYAFATRKFVRATNTMIIGLIFVWAGSFALRHSDWWGSAGVVVIGAIITVFVWRSHRDFIARNP